MVTPMNKQEMQWEAEEQFTEQYGEADVPVEERRYVSESDIHPSERY